MSVIDLFRRKESENQRDTRELIEALDSAREDMRTARLQFNYALDPELVEASVYEINSAKARYNFLLKQAREQGVVNAEVFRALR